MAEMRRNGRNVQSRYSASYGSAYVQGSTARELSAVPKRREEITPRRGVKPRRRPKISMPGMDRSSVVFVAIALAITLYICFSYVKIQNEVYKQKNTIVQMESSLAEEQKNVNDERQSVVDSVDLAEVYKTATKKLHMVRANDKQVHTYNTKKSDMVKQYGEIPESTE